MKATTGFKLIECPRDAMQGWPHFIPTEKKIAYINALLKVGFDTIDFGSFVSPKAIPQMADTKEVLKGLELSGSSSRLLAIIANKRGAEEAMIYDGISYLGFPFSVSETFQMRNTNSSVAASFENVREIQERCIKNNKELVVYISMGFGNPYGDSWNKSIVLEWIDKMVDIGIRIISLADTVGIATKEQVESITGNVIEKFPQIETGVHLHSAPENRKEKLDAALRAGCKRFDSAINGIGGCPMAGDELVGNMDTAFMLNHFAMAGFPVDIDVNQLQVCSRMASEIFI